MFRIRCYGLAANCCRMQLVSEATWGEIGKRGWYAAIDASDAFFQKAKKELTLVKYNQLKQEIMLLNRKGQSIEECLDKSSELVSSEMLQELRLLLRSGRPSRMSRVAETGH
eukprot:s742_g3.t1